MILIAKKWQLIWTLDLWFSNSGVVIKIAKVITFRIYHLHSKLKFRIDIEYEIECKASSGLNQHNINVV